MNFASPIKSWTLRSLQASLLWPEFCGGFGLWLQIPTFSSFSSFSTPLSFKTHPSGTYPSSSLDTSSGSHSPVSGTSFRAESFFYSLAHQKIFEYGSVHPGTLPHHAVLILDVHPPRKQEIKGGRTIPIYKLTNQQLIAGHFFGYPLTGLSKNGENGPRRSAIEIVLALGTHLFPKKLSENTRKPLVNHNFACRNSHQIC